MTQEPASGSEPRRPSADGGAAATADPPRPGRLMRSAPKSVWALVALYGLLLLSWSVVTPLYHAPDEPNHADAVVRIYGGLGWPAPAADVFLTGDGLSSWVASPYGRRATPLTLNPATIPRSEAVPRKQRPPWRDLRENYPPPPSNTVQLQQMVQHPPLYYAVQAAVLKASPDADDWRWDQWVGLMRVVSVLLSTALPLLAWATCMALTSNRSASLVAALLPFSIPQLTHINSVVNNDNALILFSSLVTLGLACVLRGNVTARNNIFVGICTGLALLSKSPALVLLPMIVAAYLVGARVRRPAASDVATQQMREVTARALRPVAGVMLVAFLTGGWWYAYQILRTGHVQPTVPNFPGGVVIDSTSQFFSQAWRLMVLRYWGSIGWYEVTLPFRLTAVASLVVIGFVAVAVVRTRTRSDRWSLAVLLWPTLSAFVLVVLNSYKFYLDNGRLLALQGRYLFEGVIGLAAVVGSGVAAQPHRIVRWAPLAAFALAGVMQYDALHLTLQLYWVPSGAGYRAGWNSLTAYAVWPPALLWVLLILTIAAAVVAVIAVLPNGLPRGSTGGRRAVGAPRGVRAA